MTTPSGGSPTIDIDKTRWRAGSRTIGVVVTAVFVCATWAATMTAQQVAANRRLAIQDEKLDKMARHVRIIRFGYDPEEPQGPRPAAGSVSSRPVITDPLKGTP